MSVEKYFSISVLLFHGGIIIKKVIDLAEADNFSPAP